MTQLTSKKILCWTLVLSISFLLSGCKKNDLFPQSDRMKQRMVLVHIAANNDLRGEAINSIIKLQMGAKSLNGDLLVFVKTNPLNSYLLRINHSMGNELVSDTLKTYSDENTSDASFLARVINDSRKASPAKTYGLVLWSHATAWLPPADRIFTKSFGWDNGKEMDISNLKAILPNDFEYIIFDACSMASMEVVYELKDNAIYILASPAEVLATGFPYEKITEHLFTDCEGLKYVSDLFINHYKSLSGFSSSATISLIATEKLMLIALLTKELMITVNGSLAINVSEVQRLDFDNAAAPGYDFLDFLEKHFLEHEIRDLKQAVDRTVVYKGHTESFFGSPINAFSGLTIYIPEAENQYKDYYKTLMWYNNSICLNFRGSSLFKSLFFL